MVSLRATNDTAVRVRSTHRRSGNSRDGYGDLPGNFGVGTRLGRLLGALDACDVLAFAIAAYAGARRSEIRHARVNDIDLKLGVIYVGADERGRKSRAAQRAVPLSKPLKIIMRRALLERGRPADLELLCPGSKPGGRNSGMLSFEALQARADERCKAAGPDHGARMSSSVRDVAGRCRC